MEWRREKCGGGGGGGGGYAMQRVNSLFLINFLLLFSCEMGRPIFFNKISLLFLYSSCKMGTLLQEISEHGTVSFSVSCEPYPI